MSGNNVAETPEEQGNVLTLTPCKIDLRNAHAIRRELGAVYRDMRNNKIEAAEGTKLAFVLEMLRRSYESAVLEERITKIERIIKNRRDT